ncbi:CIC11C00000000051 [Sungouiella intermedia]|uniref:Regulator of rDNA transcription 14 n=1 Tax=Sungouiella intermedia TaxID=45354 RepID=A0A1L0BSG0_9ASCO|nr:CIC11C00000000051 [[Candida] intermedia]
MAFSSNTSKARAKATVNKLFESMLPGTALTSLGKQGASATEKFAREISKKRLSKEEIRKANKAERVKQNKVINKKLESDKKFQKLVKYQVIKSHKSTENLSAEEQKYLKKLIKKNSNAVKRAGGVDDPFVQEEIEDLRKEILELSNEKYKKSKERKLDAKLESFNHRLHKKEYKETDAPGLTPGLAPVGFDESDDE